MKSHTYTTTIVSALVIASSFTLANAEDADPAAKPKIEALSAEELASRKASIPLIEERIKDREDQIKILIDDMKRISDRIEKRIDKIVSTLEKMKDSQNSKIRVAKMKQDTMKGLYRSIEDFNRRRAQFKEQLRTGKADIGEDAANKAVELIGEKIEKRAEQMIALSKSFTEHVDYKKYENDTSGSRYNYGNRWGGDNTRTNEKWKQNRRETTFTDSQRKKMIKAIKTSIDDLERRNNTLRIKTKEAKGSEATQKFYHEEIARNEKTIDTRRKQLADILQPGYAAATTSVDRNRAHDTELLIREVADDIRRDHRTNISNFHDLKQRLTSLNRIKLNLAARKEWLGNYDAAHGAEAE